PGREVPRQPCAARTAQSRSRPRRRRHPHRGSARGARSAGGRGRAGGGGPVGLGGPAAGRRRHPAGAVPGLDRQRARSAAGWRMDAAGGGPRPDLPLLARAVLGRRPLAREGDPAARAERARGRGLDRPVQGALRPAWHARTRERGQDQLAWLHPPDQLGRAGAGGGGPPRHARAAAGLAVRVLLWLLVGAALAAAVQVARMAPEERAGALRVERTPASRPARVAPAPGGDAGQAGVRGPGATGPRPAAAPAGDAATPAGTAAGTPPWLRDTGHAPPAAPPVAATPGPSGLLVPVQGVDPASLQPTFDDARGEGRAHEALDIMAPAGTPVLAVADGH